jgi:hypothetical protein
MGAYRCSGCDRIRESKEHGFHHVINGERERDFCEDCFTDLLFKYDEGDAEDFFYFNEDKLWSQIAGYPPGECPEGYQAGEKLG